MFVSVIVHIIARAGDPFVRALKMMAIIHIIVQAGDVVLPISIINGIIGRALKSSRTTIMGIMLRVR